MFPKVRDKIVIYFKMIKHFKLLFIGLVFVLIFGATGIASALEAGGIGAKPAYFNPDDPKTTSWFVYTLEPDESVENALLVFNNKDRETTIEVYAVDSKLSNIGQFALSAKDEEKKDIGAWVKFESGEEVVEVTLAPNSREKVPFTITVPKDADAGEHSGAIVIQEKIPSQMTGGGAVVVTRIGTRIYATVPGEIVREISFPDFKVNYDKEKKQFFISLILKNESNVTLYPKIKLFIKDEFFNKKSGIIETSPQLSRGAQINVDFNWSKPRLLKFLTYPGRFSFQVKVSYDDEGEIRTKETEKTSFWIIPWKELLIFGLIILILAIYFENKRRLVKKERKRMKEYIVSSGDTVETIAAKFGMNWKKLTKINKLKPPYTLKQGEKIMVIEKPND